MSIEVPKNEVSRRSADVPAGRYRHYKGKEYTVIGVAKHSETEEELVVYRQEYGEYGLWVRPKGMFLETVKVECKVIPRFQYLGTAGQDEPARPLRACPITTDFSKSLA